MQHKTLTPLRLAADGPVPVVAHDGRPQVPRAVKPQLVLPACPQHKTTGVGTLILRTFPGLMSKSHVKETCGLWPPLQYREGVKYFR